MDLGFSDAMRSAGKTKVVKEMPPWESYRTFLQEKKFPHLNGTSSISAFRVYEECWDEKTPEKEICTAERFTEEIYPDDYVMTEAQVLLDHWDKSKPFFMQVNFPGPHPPIMATQEMANKVKDRSWPEPVEPNMYSWGKMECPQNQPGSKDGPQFNGRCNYAAEVENLDRLMKQIVDHVDQKGELGKTVVCITGDHGEMLGDHGMQGKMVPWQASISVPLVCFGHGVAKGLIDNDPVTTLDLGGTFMDMAGIKTFPDGMTTRSMRSIMRGVPPAGGRRQVVSSGLKDWRAVVKNVGGFTYKLVCCRGKCNPAPKGTPELTPGQTFQMLLYNVKADPYDQHPVTDELPGVAMDLQDELPPGWCPLHPAVAEHFRSLKAKRIAELKQRGLGAFANLFGR